MVVDELAEEGTTIPQVPKEAVQVVGEKPGLGRAVHSKSPWGIDELTKTGPRK